MNNNNEEGSKSLLKYHYGIYIPKELNSILVQEITSNYLSKELIYNFNSNDSIKVSISNIFTNTLVQFKNSNSLILEIEVVENALLSTLLDKFNIKELLVTFINKKVNDFIREIVNNLLQEKNKEISNLTIFDDFYYI